VAGGIEHGIQAIGAAVRWSRGHRQALVAQAERSRAGRDRAEPTDPTARARAAGQAEGPAGDPLAEASGNWAGASGTWAEDRAAAVLAAHGVPVVPTRRAVDEEAAVEAAGSLGYPAVVKAVSANIVHKTDVGAVRLAVPDPDAVRAAYREVHAAACAVGGEHVRVLVQPYRAGGVELIAGVVRDPSWGLVLAVGLGGIWVEVLRDAALRVLPPGPDEIRCALGELRGAAVLQGARGAEPADLGRVADVIARIAAVATHLGDRLESLEVNPLLVRGAHVEALDALITWRS
jgi:acyl-CoA synthetase (NDP forming)